MNTFLANLNIMKKFLTTILLLFCYNYADANCVFNSSDLNFGTYSSPGQKSDLLSSTNILVICDLFSLGSGFSIKLLPGQSNNSSNRYLSNGKDKLYYNLFLNSGRSSVWGDGNNGTSYYNGVTLLIVKPTIFSSVYKGQNVSPGFYSDSISFEISF